MRKIIFEQLINISLTILLTFAFVEATIYSTYGPNPGEFQLIFPPSWSLLVVMIITASILRLLYTKTFGRKDGYTKSEAELSSSDEREKLISLHASKFSYQALPYMFAIVMPLTFFLNVFLADQTTLRVLPIIHLGSCLVLHFLNYLVAWIIYDNRI